MIYRERRVVISEQGIVEDVTKHATTTQKTTGGYTAYIRGTREGKGRTAMYIYIERTQSSEWFHVYVCFNYIY